MAYTYDQFITAATGAGILDKFTDDDLNIAKNNPEYGMSALKLQQDLQGAKTTEQKLLAQESLNQLRKSYGGVVASSTAPTTQNAANPAGSFNYGNETIYQQMLKDVTEPKPFEYDVAKDPNFQSMKKNYLREGDRAREDTMASFSSMTGGVPSSAAITAAQQAGDYYATQLNDSIPNLQQNAYQRYLADLDAKQAALGAITTDRNFDWQKYLQEQDQQMAAKQQEWNNAFALYQKLGYATPEIAAILGIESNVPQKNVYYGPDTEEEIEDNRGYLDVMSAYIGLKKQGANSRDLDNMLRAAMNDGMLSLKQASDLRDMRW